MPDAVLLTDNPPRRIRSVPRDVDPHALLDRVHSVILLPGTTPCEVAVLAMLRGIPVHGLDGDTAEAPARALALLVDHTRYHDPFTGERIDAEAAIRLLAEWRQVIARNRSVSVLVGMAWWKKRRMKELFSRAEPRRPTRFGDKAALVVRTARREGGAVACWSSRVPPKLFEHANRWNVPILQVEDGFIRSLGLGSGFLPPASVVVDGRGLYLDPGQPSDLEVILATYPFDDALRKRASALVDRLTQENISKYAAGTEKDVGAAVFPVGRRIVLVVGQVADDLSVRLGGGEVESTLDLLRRVRAEEPGAWLVFRPHPDVDAGFRRGAVPDAEAMKFVDQIARGGSITALLGRVERLHTLTSLAGFEAVIRGVPVVCWGQPFYAGWGLTDDRAPIARRSRVLSREDLAAGCLLVYPRYIDPLTRLPCGPETVIDRLLVPALWKPSLPMRLRRMQGLGLLRLRSLLASGPGTKHGDRRSV